MSQRKGESRETYLARVRERQRDYRAANLDKVRAANRVYCERHRNKKRAYDRERYAANPEPMKGYQVGYRQQHKERLNAYNAAYRQANAERCRAAINDWFRRHPYYQNETHARRKAQKLQTQFGRVDYQRILERDRGICGICDKPIETGTLSFDHIIPLAKGGVHAEENIQAAHLRCNIQKGAKLMSRHEQAGEALV